MNIMHTFTTQEIILVISGIAAFFLIAGFVIYALCFVAHRGDKQIEKFSAEGKAHEPLAEIGRCRERLYVAAHAFEITRRNADSSEREINMAVEALESAAFGFTVANLQHSVLEGTESATFMNKSNIKNDKAQCPLAPATCSASRLWRVTVEYELLVVADTERQAESEAEYYSREDGSSVTMTVANEIRKIEDVPADWQDSIPFGGDRKDERTCRERVTPNQPDGANPNPR